MPHQVFGCHPLATCPWAEAERQKSLKPIKGGEGTRWGLPPPPPWAGSESGPVQPRLAVPGGCSSWGIARIRLSLKGREAGAALQRLWGSGDGGGKAFLRRVFPPSALEERGCAPKGGPSEALPGPPSTPLSWGHAHPLLDLFLPSQQNKLLHAPPTLLQPGICHFSKQLWLPWRPGLSTCDWIMFSTLLDLFVWTEPAPPNPRNSSPSLQGSFFSSPRSCLRVLPSTGES